MAFSASFSSITETSARFRASFTGGDSGFLITDMSGLTLIEIPMRSGVIQSEALHLPFLKQLGDWTLELLMTGKHSLDMRMRQGPLHG